MSANVPLTIQRYSDNEFVEGQQPITASEATVMVTSDCNATTYVPQVTFSGASSDGKKMIDTIDVNVQGVPSGDMPYLESSSYYAAWSTEDYWCRHSQTQSPGPAPAVTSRKTRLNEGRAFSIRKLFQRLKLLWSNEIATATDQLDLISSTNVCNVNVEIMIDGCSHSVDVSDSTPTVRVIDSTLNNTQYEPSSEDQCVTNIETDILFNSIVKKKKVRRGINEKECYRPVPGRPFVDSLGKNLHAEAVVVGKAEVQSEGVWSARDVYEQVDAGRSLSASSSFDNSTSTISSNQLRLGQQWKKNALGEHASIASFSAFSIALMTNGAPSELVENALIAGLDEIRHAQTSFDIASKLLGEIVIPGPLPPSKHEFDHDLKTLAMAVAKEGCVDETLSALELAAEIHLLNAILNEAVSGTKYDDIDHEVLTWIRDELHTIASEESNHAALAWRTIDWVCSIDSDVCNAVKEQVLNEDELEKAFHRRFGTGGHEILEEMKDGWKKISSRVDSSAQDCMNGDRNLSS